MGQPLEPLRAAAEVTLSQVGRPSGRTVGRVRDPDPVAEHFELLGRADEMGREPGCVEQAPEVVPRVGEMRRPRVGVEAGVDPAEHDVEPGREAADDWLKADLAKLGVESSFNLAETFL